MDDRFYEGASFRRPRTRMEKWMALVAGRPEVEQKLMAQMGLPPQAVRDAGALILEEESEVVAVPDESVVRAGMREVLVALQTANGSSFANSSLRTTEDWTRWAGDWTPEIIDQTSGSTTEADTPTPVPGAEPSPTN